MRRRAVAALAGCLGAGLLSAACSSGSAAGGSGAGSASDQALLAAEPYLQLQSAREGYLVWPSASAWLVLRTTDGFRSVQNRTPVAVETDGGLVGSFDRTRSVVAVAPTGALYRSPLLTARSAGPWSPAELPGAVTGTRGAVGVQPGSGRLTAVITKAGGTVVERTPNGWRSLIDATRLAPASGLRLQTVTWLTARVAIVTGTVPRPGRDAAVAYRTADAGATWHPVANLPAGASTALAPCRTATAVVLPVLAGVGNEVMVRSQDDGANWSRGTGFAAAPDEPAVGCSASAIWSAGHAPGGTYVLVSTDDGRSWRPAGAVPAGLTALAPTGAGTGYATTGGASPALYAVGDGARTFRRIVLPSWVATIGQSMSGN